MFVNMVLIFADHQGKKKKRQLVETGGALRRNVYGKKRGS